MSIWLKAIRVRFLLASIIAVSVGLAIAWWKFQQFDLFYALLTYAGVACLHASVDLLNDYWDYKRGIDKLTERTPFSGSELEPVPGKHMVCYNCKKRLDCSKLLGCIIDKL